MLSQPKRLAFLVYLAAASRGFHRRDTLLALFWPDLDAARARDALNSAVRFLRRALGAGCVVSRGSEEIGIDATQLWCDAAAFGDHADAGRSAEALELYRGDLLPGFFAEGGGGFEEWLERERARLRGRAAKAARSLAEARERERNFTVAVSIARRAVELSDIDERVVRGLLELLDRLGDRAGAIHAYEAFSRRLAQELDAEPAAETTALIQRIRARSSPASPATRSTPMPEVVVEPTSADRANDRAAGARFNGWQVVRELGRGGMAIVYLARDLKHDRHVALKTMRPELAITLGADRFLREIEITARLAHPHILPLIDSGAADGTLYLVTPYVAGESLRARLVRGGRFPVADAIRIAGEVAEALDYAHRSGVIHRDIKPENILLADGHAIVADFGVARAVIASGSPREHADDAVLVGSPPYMSPEARSGAAVSARTDIYSLGCVLGEMLTGEVPGGSDSPWPPLARRADVPASVRRLLADCLATRPEDRPASTADVLQRLEALNGGVGAAASPSGRSWRIPRRVLLTGGLGAAVVVAYAASRVAPHETTIDIDSTRQLTNTPGLELDPAISPDGKLIAYAAGTPRRMRIYVRQLAGGRVVEVSGDAMRLHRWPAWSPDGSQIAFVASDGDRLGPEAKVLVVPALGGTPRLIADRLMYFDTPAWSPDGRYLAYPTEDSIVVRGVNDESARTIAARPDAHSIAWSPDGKRLAFVSGNASYTFSTTAFGNLSPTSIWTVGVDGGVPQPVTGGPSVSLSPAWGPDSRHLLYVSNAGGAFDVYQTRVDGSGRASVPPRRLTTGLNAHGISLSRDGSRLAYSVLNYRSNIFAAPINASGPTPTAAIQAITEENRTIETADISRDGAWLVFDSNRDGRSHIYKMPATGGDPIQLTHDAADDFAPRWSPDGKRIAFHSRRTNERTRDVYVMNADGRDVVQITTDSADENYPRFSPDGRSILFTRAASGLMTSTLGPDGRWGPPMSVKGPGRGGAWWTADGRVLVQHRGPDLYAQSITGESWPLATSAELNGRITALTAGPDPGTVYFRLIDTAGVHSIYSVRVAGGPPRLLLRLDGTLRQPARIIFSTDGRRLYFTLTDAESDIWVMALDRS